jgi:hypothetical protein
MDPANQNISALITSKNKPKVTIVIGRVNKIRMGLTNILIKPKTAAASIADQKLATTMPGKTYATTSSVTAFNIQTNNSVMIFSGENN